MKILSAYRVVLIGILLSASLTFAAEQPFPETAAPPTTWVAQG